MPITWLDILLLGVMLVSGLLAMVRGGLREVLSITAWAAAAVATLLAYPRLLPIAKANISSDIVATGTVIGGVFLVTLLIVSIITVRISDMVLDSRVGALDRTLGFLYGAARGILVVAVALLFFDWLVGAHPPAWITDAKSRPLLESIGAKIQSLLPDDPENSILKRLVPGGGDDEQAAPPEAGTEAPPAETPPADAPADAPPAEGGTNN